MEAYDPGIRGRLTACIQWLTLSGSKLSLVFGSLRGALALPTMTVNVRVSEEEAAAGGLLARYRHLETRELAPHYC